MSDNKPSEISAITFRMTTVLSSIHGELADLRDRLAPILEPPVPDAADGVRSVPEEPKSPLGMELNDLLMRAEDIRDATRDIANRLSV